MTIETDSVFEDERRKLFSLAYRMLGSVDDAEDTLQEAYMRWSRIERGRLENPAAYLTTIVSRLSIDRLRARRETEYIGPWLPAPLPTQDPVERAETISMAFLVLLEELQAVERAVFLLKEVFAFSHDEIASMLQISAASSRKSFQRAKGHIRERRRRFVAAPENCAEIVQTFFAAVTNGDVGTLVNTLREDITVWSDGGGEVAAARIPVAGREAVIKFFIGIAKQAPADLSVEPRWLNGEYGVLLHVEGRVDSAFIFEFEGALISALRVVRNPKKLAHLQESARGG